VKATFLEGQNAKIITSQEVISSVNQAGGLENVGLTAVAGSGALTVALKQKDASTDASVRNPVRITHPSSAVASGAYTVNEITAALSVVIPSGATLGYADGDDVRVHIYALDNAGTEEFAVAGARVFKESGSHTTTTIGTGSDLGTTLYSTTGTSDITIRYLGFAQINAITTAGTWTAPTSLRLNQGQPTEDEYIQVDVVSRPVSALVDTPVAGTEELDVRPGRWRLGHHVLWRLSDNTGSGTVFEANVHLFDGSAVIDKTQMYKTVVLATNETHITQHPIFTIVDFAVTTTVTIRTQASVAGATGASQLEDPEQRGGFSGDDAASRIFAERIEV